MPLPFGFRDDGDGDGDGNGGRTNAQMISGCYGGSFRERVNRHALANNERT